MARVSAEGDRQWRVGELAGATGLTVRALHHYDAIGLLVPSQRTSGGHRGYDPGDVRRLYRILALRRLGLRLDEIASLLDDGGAGLLETVRRHLEQVERDLAQQQRLRERLHQILEALQRSAEPSAEDYLDAVEAMTMIEVDVQDVVMLAPVDAVGASGPQSPRETMRVVLLKEHEGERILAIWIGAPEGNAFVLARSGHKLSRPMGPDLTAELLRAGGVRVERVVIESLRERTFFATVVIAVAGETQEVDARPSDALNLAARLGAPVFAASEVMDDAAGLGDEPLRRLLPGDDAVHGQWRSLTPDLVMSLRERPLDEAGRRVLAAAQEAARTSSHGYVWPEHLLLGLLSDPGALASRVLESLGVTAERVRASVETRERAGTKLTGDAVPLAVEARMVLGRATAAALSRDRAEVGPEDLLLGLGHEDGLLAYDVTTERLTEEVDRARRAALSTSEASPETAETDDG